jgi:GNAT superfamily N-acetyltransferase
MDSISYFQAQSTDIADLVSLLATLFSIEQDFKPDYSNQEKGLALLIRSPNTGTICVAKNTKGQVIGMVSAQLVISTAQGASSAWVEDMVVEEAYRGQGIGKKLLQQALDWAKTKGATRAQLLVDLSNSEALGYYQHLQWEPTQLQARRIFL